MTERAGVAHGQKVKRYACRQATGCGNVMIVSDLLNALVIEDVADSLSNRPRIARLLSPPSAAVDAPSPLVVIKHSLYVQAEIPVFRLCEWSRVGGPNPRNGLIPHFCDERPIVDQIQSRATAGMLPTNLDARIVKVSRFVSDTYPERSTESIDHSKRSGQPRVVTLRIDRAGGAA